MTGDVRQVGHLAGAVDDHEEVASAVREHQVIENAARVIEQQSVAQPAFGQTDHVHRHQRLESCPSLLALQPELPHVGDIEQPGSQARVQVLGHEAARVLHRHFITGEGHHARAQGQVQGMQRRLAKFGGWCRQGVGHGVLRGRCTRSVTRSSCATRSGRLALAVPGT